MKKANLVLMAALAAAGLVGVTGGVVLPVSTAVAASDKAKDKDKGAPKGKLTPAVQKPLAAAQTAMNAKNWDEAQTQIDAARAVGSTEPYDLYMIDEMGWYVALQKKDYVKSSEALERVLATGMVPDADKPTRLRALTQMELQNKQYAKALQYGDQYLQVNPTDNEIALSLAQARYLSGDIPGAKAAADKLVAASPKPAEQALLLQLRASYELKDDASTGKALENLVRLYPQQKYWNDLLNNQLFRTKDDRGVRAIYRLMQDTGTLNKGDYYAEMAGNLINGGYPNEAKQVLEKGMAESAFQGQAKTRAQADLDRARAGATADAKELPNAAGQLASAKTGNQMVAIGKLYFSAGDYAKAADAIQKGLAKGGVTDADDANLLLGIAQARQGKAAEANAAFDAVKAPVLTDVAKLWKIKVETAGAPEQAPAAPAAG